MLREIGSQEEALDRCRRALQLRGDYPEAHHNLGLILKEQGEIDSAIAHIQKALRLNPALAEAHNSLGTVLLAKHRLTEALGRFRKALALKTDFTAAHSNLLHNLHYRSTDPEGLFREHRRWGPAARRTLGRNPCGGTQTTPILSASFASAMSPRTSAPIPWVSSSSRFSSPAIGPASR